jgi:hypothetical protein
VVHQPRHPALPKYREYQQHRRCARRVSGTPSLGYLERGIDAEVVVDRKLVVLACARLVPPLAKVRHLVRASEGACARTRTRVCVGARGCVRARTHSHTPRAAAREGLASALGVRSRACRRAARVASRVAPPRALVRCAPAEASLRATRSRPPTALRAPAAAALARRRTRRPSRPRRSARARTARSRSRRAPCRSRAACSEGTHRWCAVWPAADARDGPGWGYIRAEGVRSARATVQWSTARVR